MKSYMKVEGADHDDTFASVSQYSSIRAVISIVEKMGWKINHMVVNTAFLDVII